MAIADLPLSSLFCLARTSVKADFTASEMPFVTTAAYDAGLSAVATIPIVDVIRSLELLDASISCCNLCDKSLCISSIRRVISAMLDRSSLMAASSSLMLLYVCLETDSHVSQ